VRRTFILFLLLFVASPLRALENYEDWNKRFLSIMPEYWHQYILYDQLCQIWERRSEISSMSRRTVITMHEFWVKKSDVKIIKSLRSEKALSMFTTSDGDIRILVPDYGDRVWIYNYFENIRKKLGEVKRRWVGYRLQGHGSYMIWADDFTQDQTPLILKVEIPEPGDKSTHNHEDAGLQAVNTERAIESLQQNQPHLEIPYFPEPLAITYYGEGFNYSVSVREMPDAKFYVGEDLHLLPTHGLVGSILPAQFSRKKNVRETQWFQNEYSSKLGEFVGYLNFVLGLFPVLHTQNAATAVNMKLGSIHKFMFKDLADTLVHPLIWALRGYSVPISKKNRPFIQSKDLLEETEAYKDPAMFHAMYINQSITNNHEGTTYRVTDLLAFFKNVMVAADLEIKDLSEDSQKRLERFAKNENDDNSKVKYGKKELDYLQAECFLIFRDIYKLALRKMLIARLNQNENELLPDQVPLEKVFLKKLDKGDVQWAFPRNGGKFSRLKQLVNKRLRYLNTAQGIIVYDEKEMEPLGLAIEYSDCEGKLTN